MALLTGRLKWWPQRQGAKSTGKYAPAPPPLAPITRTPRSTPLFRGHHNICLRPCAEIISMTWHYTASGKVDHSAPSVNHSAFSQHSAFRIIKCKPTLHCHFKRFLLIAITELWNLQLVHFDTASYNHWAIVFCYILIFYWFVTAFPSMCLRVMETQYCMAATGAPLRSLLRCRVLRKLRQLAHRRAELSEPVGLCGSSSGSAGEFVGLVTVQTGRWAADSGSLSWERRAGRSSRAGGSSQIRLSSLLTQQPTLYRVLNYLLMSRAFYYRRDSDYCSELMTSSTALCNGGNAHKFKFRVT